MTPIICVKAIFKFFASGSSMLTDLWASVIEFSASYGGLYSWLLHILFSWYCLVICFEKFLTLDMNNLFLFWCMNIVYFGFCCPLWSFGEYGSFLFPDRKGFWYHDMCYHSDFHVKCLSRYWELALRNRASLQGGRGSECVHLRDEIRVFHQNFLSLVWMGSKSKERSQQKICYQFLSTIMCGRT